MNRIVIALLLLQSFSAQAAESLAKIKWAEPRIAAQAEGGRVQLTVSGQVSPGTKLEMDGQPLVLISGAGGAGDRVEKIFASDIVEAKMAPTGEFQLTLKVPVGDLFLPIRVRYSDGSEQNFQLAYEVRDKSVLDRSRQELSPGVQEQINAQASAVGRGVDFRIQIEKSDLSMVTVANRATQLAGLGSSVSAHFYWWESERWRSTLLIASRFYNFVGTGLPSGESESVQFTSLAPGVELQYRSFYLQGTYHLARFVDYLTASTSSNKTISLALPRVDAGFNFRFNKLALGLGVYNCSGPIAASALGISRDTTFQESGFSLNFVYFFDRQPKAFFKDLF